jgi:hypothetical protein
MAQRAKAYRCSSMDSTLGRKLFDGKHVQIKVELLDRLVRSAVIAAYFEDPEPDSVRAADSANLAQLHADLTASRGALSDLAQALKDQVIRYGDYSRLFAEAEADRERIEAEIGHAVAESAHAAMLSGAWLKSTLTVFDDPSLVVGNPEIGEFPLASLMSPEQRAEGERNTREAWREETETELGEQFDALPVAKQRVLVKSLFKVVVESGRTTARINISAVR